MSVSMSVCVCVCLCVKERKKKKEREREINSQTDGQADRQTKIAREASFIASMDVVIAIASPPFREVHAAFYAVI